MKAVKIILAGLAIIFVLIQFIPWGIPENKPETSDNIIHGEFIPEQIIFQLKVSCFDCHSDQTNFPWYSKIAPVSWWLAGHISEGKEHLNFSNWAQYSKREKLGLLEDIIEETESGAMPLRSYLIVHRDARLNNEKITSIKNWGEETADRLFE
ncbi:MAG TPA: heme-binding domain-containing protein [Bacteroidales bacterium]|nr:heme-binding domain-containing protein [Bacteroidales bacterium]